ncbi:MAG TPA: hypothetical protein DCP69_04025 [Candidatus Omnitrophica bacterium]|nr:hypothetical protein [Candidatus Omnitrophota bacterium]
MPTVSEKIEQAKATIAAAVACMVELDAVLKERNAQTLAMIAQGQRVTGHLGKASDCVTILAEQEERQK